jgi:hypothetical protein
VLGSLSSTLTPVVAVKSSVSSASLDCGIASSPGMSVVHPVRVRAPSEHPSGCLSGD